MTFRVYKTMLDDGSIFRVYSCDEENRPFGEPFIVSPTLEAVQDLVEELQEALDAGPVDDQFRVIEFVPDSGVFNGD